MRLVNIHEAKAHFFKLVEDVMRGGEIIIAIGGKPVAHLGPISKKPIRGQLRKRKKSYVKTTIVYLRKSRTFPLNPSSNFYI